MTINVYLAHDPDTSVETYDIKHHTIGEFFDSQNADRDRLYKYPPHVEKNGEIVKPEEYDTVLISKYDDVKIYLPPNGGVFKALGSLLGGALGFVFGWLLPSSKSPSRRDTPQGKQLNQAMGTAIQSRHGEVVPEIAGRHKRYPDYLTPPRRYFASPREQRLEFLACVGVGRYQINDADVKVGDTPISSLGADGSYQIFEPNTNLSGVATHQHWCTVDEVGGTSSGTAGLELSTEPANRANSDPASYTFNGLTITRSDGHFPSGWGNGTLVSINYPRQYVAADTTLTGFFGHSGTNVGSYFGDDWNTEVRESQGGGYYTLSFWRMKTVEGSGDQPDYEIKRYLQFNPGTYTYDFAPNVKWTIASNDEGSITLLDEGRFFENGVSISSSISFEGGSVYGEWTSEFVVTPGNEVTSTLELDFFFPGGLAYIEDDGRLSSRSVQIEFQYRYLSNNNTFSVFRTYNQSSLDQIGFTERINIAQGAVTCRVRRIGSSSTSTQVHDTVHWYGLKCRLPTRTRYPNWTTISIQLRSGGRIAAQSENKINVIATRILPTLQSNGSWSAPQPTRDISAAVKYIADTIGYNDSDIDMDELLRLHSIWKSRNETLDYVFSETTVKKALDLALGAGMAELTVADGKIRPVRDDVRTTFESGHGYSPQNMTKALVRTFSTRAPDDPDGVEVEFINADTWQSDTVLCRLPGDQGFKLEKIKVEGVTDRTRAYRIGMRYRSSLRYNRWEYNFNTELDAMNSQYLSYVPLLSDMPGYGKAVLLTHIEQIGSRARMRVNEPLELEEGENHVVAYRRTDGTVAGPYPVEGGSEFEILADIPKPWPVVTLKHELPHVYFGTSKRWCFPALITNIKPSANGESVAVQARNYDARTYAFDDSYPSEE